MLASDLAGQVADLLGVVADSTGGSVFGDTSANVAYRPRDWQTYTPGTPLDGTIGNVEKGQPGYWIPGTPYEPGYLTPTVGIVSTPDPGPLPAECTFVVTIRKPVSGGDCALVSQDDPSSRSWVIMRSPGGDFYNYLFYDAAGTPPQLRRHPR